MAGVKGNRRIIYTKKIIRDSLIELLQNKDIHQITVTDVCKKADINRGTFYTHYKDCFDLLQSIEDELFNLIIKYIDETPVEEYSNSLLLRVLELISENKDLCKILFCKQNDNRILERILSVASKADFEKLCGNSNKFIKSNMDYFIRYSVGGCIYVIQGWLENNLPHSPLELVKIINSVNSFGNNFAN